MRRILTLTYVLVALTAPLLCQAEAAEGLARSFSELVARGVIETAEPECDGLCSASMQAKAECAIDLHHVEDATPGTFLLAPVAPLPGLSHPNASGPNSWPLAPAVRSQAYLQVFLF